MGRFLNADAFATTGQGLLGNNMFAYCGNNPTIRNDTEGNSWAVVGIGAAVSIITGLANGYSSYASGGKFWPAFWIGIGAGSIGYALSLTTKNPLTLVSIRSLTSLGSNLLTTEANNGRITAEDWVVSAWDAIMDGVFSTFTYFYNPFSSDFLSNIFNAVVDGFTDITETWLYNSPLEEQSSASPTTRYSGRIQPYNTIKSNKRILLY